MANTIKVRRGTDANRAGVTPAEGELLYTTDTKKVYVGDGSTAGGNEVGGGSQTPAELLADIKTVDGSGSGLDADLLDGQQGSYYAAASSLSSYLPKANNSDYQLQVWDNRNTDTSTDLGSQAAVFEFKANSTDSLSDGGTYHGVLTLQQWGDPSGGNTHQLAFTDNGNLHLRSVAIGGTWPTNWSKIWHSNNDGSGSGLDADLLDGQHASAFQPAGTYNTVIGTDSDINTSGSTIIDNIYVTDGVITSMGTRTLTAADIGAITGNQTITLTGDVSGSGTTSINAQIAANVVGANELNVSGNGTSGQVLSSDGDGSMTWTTPSSGGVTTGKAIAMAIVFG